MLISGLDHFFLSRFAPGQPSHTHTCPSPFAPRTFPTLAATGKCAWLPDGWATHRLSMPPRPAHVVAGPAPSRSYTVPCFPSSRRPTTRKYRCASSSYSPPPPSPIGRDNSFSLLMQYLRQEEHWSSKSRSSSCCSRPVLEQQKGERQNLSWKGMTFCCS